MALEVGADQDAVFAAFVIGIGMQAHGADPRIEAALRDTVIVAKSAGEGLGVSLLHWIIGDSQRSIVVEMMADGLHVYDDPVDTLANQPTFPWHMENLRTYITATSDFPQTAT